MFDEKTILTRLQNGEDVQSIADEMAALINAANKTYTDQKAAEEAAKAAVVQKVDELQNILDMFFDWFDVYYDVDVEPIRDELKADQVIELIDSIKEYVEALKGLESMLDSKKSAAKATKSNTKSKSTDEKISDFLNKMGW